MYSHTSGGTIKIRNQTSNNYKLKANYIVLITMNRTIGDFKSLLFDLINKY